MFVLGDNNVYVVMEYVLVCEGYEYIDSWEDYIVVYVLLYGNEDLFLNDVDFWMLYIDGNV